MMMRKRTKIGIASLTLIIGISIITVAVIIYQNQEELCDGCPSPPTLIFKVNENAHIVTMVRIICNFFITI